MAALDQRVRDLAARLGLRIGYITATATTLTARYVADAGNRSYGDAFAVTR